MHNHYLDIFDGLMKMLDYNNQELYGVINNEDESQNKERRTLAEYNAEHIKVFEHLKTMKKLEI
ncbi:MAG: hypothetical protein HeimAB125_01180 [Candidatus Heimdallarchaeota archaeon AB_125]|nr:MAG: hypothetical protein HeimAB125_01180 [Candidatus Heimdallarchaeota archaeon AB_125]